MEERRTLAARKPEVSLDRADAFIEGGARIWSLSEKTYGSIPLANVLTSGAKVGAGAAPFGF